MVVFTDAQKYFEQSRLLLQARPSTPPPLPQFRANHPVPFFAEQTRITTKYTVPKPSRRPRRAAPSTAEGASAAAAATSAPAKARLTLKTYDPVSGACLKYVTDKQAEVGRLVAGLGRCARTVAAVPGGDDDEAGEAAAPPQPASAAGSDAAAAASGSAAATPRVGTPQPGAKSGPQQAGNGGGGGAGGGGGKKGKKKGKR